MTAETLSPTCWGVMLPRVPSWGFPKIGVPFFKVPVRRIFSIWGIKGVTPSREIPTFFGVRTSDKQVSGSIYLGQPVLYKSVWPTCSKSLTYNFKQSAKTPVNLLEVE